MPAESLIDEAIALALAITANSPGGVRMSKRALQANQEITSYAAALELENRGQALLTRGSDMPEALCRVQGEARTGVHGPTATSQLDLNPRIFGRVGLATISAITRPTAGGCATACSGT